MPCKTCGDTHVIWSFDDFGIFGCSPCNDCEMTEDDKNKQDAAFADLRAKIKEMDEDD